MANLAGSLFQLDKHVLTRSTLLGQSSSHDQRHTGRVLDFALELAANHGGDPEILILASRLHDLGRGDTTKHGDESVDESCRLAATILRELEIDQDKTQRVLEVIQDHDKTSRPRSLEGRILKDADFLAGFGAWGILRTCMWSAESGQGVDGAFQRLKVGMPSRMRSLEFPESRRYALCKYGLVRWFLEELGSEPILRDQSYSGYYVAFEGISGSGKDTQIRLLRQRLEAQGVQSVVVAEPPWLYRDARSFWQETLGIEDAHSADKIFLLLASRIQSCRELIAPALRAGKVVLSSRSYLSTLVYQQTPDISFAEISAFHSILPPFDRIFIIDANPHEAFARITRRAKRDGSEVSEYERLELLREHRSRFLKLAEDPALMLQTVIIPPGGPQETADRVWADIGLSL